MVKITAFVFFLIFGFVLGFVLYTFGLPAQEPGFFFFMVSIAAFTAVYASFFVNSLSLALQNALFFLKAPKQNRIFSFYLILASLTGLLFPWQIFQLRSGKSVLTFKALHWIHLLSLYWVPAILSILLLGYFHATRGQPRPKFRLLRVLILLVVTGVLFFMNRHGYISGVSWLRDFFSKPRLM